jgi:GrpB-like predicted nucleotidyltransferase (UPF0157 family)/aminoglycoside phosphotransferase (APT) family kinase protein/GNAT superfamily N-acetyltransferase
VTFKANWEKTSTRVNLSEDLMLKMLGTYTTCDNDIKSVSVIPGGCANINVLVELNDSDTPIILRVYLRDKDSVYREQKISSLLHKKLPLPEFYHVGEYDGYTFAIIEYLPGQTLRDLLLKGKSLDISDIMFKVGRTLGETAKIKFPSSGFFNKNLEIEKSITLEGFVDFCFECLENNKVKATLPQKQRDQIKNIFRVYKNLLPDESEANLVHADFDPANILVTEVNGQVEVSGILDWEFSFAGSTLCDVANMLRYAYQMPNEYQDSFLKGLRGSGYELSSSWQITVNLLNIVSMLDCLVRSDSENRPNQIKDIQELIANILDVFSKVEIVPYDPSWPNIFDIEAEKIKTALGDSFSDIHHVGSTSVPGLAAKPKIDIIACARNLDFDHQGLTNLNYEYRGGFNLPLRKSFTYRSPSLNVNLHIFEENDPEVELNLLFRDYLRKNPEVRDQYAALKYKLLEDEASHKKDGAMYYTLGKHDLIQDILNKSGFKLLRFVICTHYTEWKAAKHFRNKYFFEPNKIEDPYTWTFDHKDHKHFILYKGVNIVGYAHVQLWPENRAALRIIVIDEKEQGEGYGREFMFLIEKWLQLEGYKSIHTESSPAALGFYKRLNYKEMPFNDPDGYEGSPEDIAMGKLL